MSKNSVKLRCRACRQSFCARKEADGGWRTQFPSEPPSWHCAAHVNSALCRWEVNKLRTQLWEKMAPHFEGKSAAFLTVVLPHRTVPYDKLGKLRLRDEKRAIQRMLDKVLPKDIGAVAIFDIDLDDDQTGGWRDRVWMPHYHVLVV